MLARLLLSVMCKVNSKEDEEISMISISQTFLRLWRGERKGIIRFSYACEIVCSYVIIGRILSLFWQRGSCREELCEFQYCRDTGDAVKSLNSLEELVLTVQSSVISPQSVVLSCFMIFPRPSRPFPCITVFETCWFRICDRVRHDVMPCTTTQSLIRNIPAKWDFQRTHS
jgi:hypothetical protein